LKEINERKKSKKGTGNEDDSEWEDVDEHEKEVFATTGYFDIPEQEALISKQDQDLLE
jgi:essential nuclear protein 1